LVFSTQHRKGIASALAGKKKSPEHCRKNGEAKRGKKQTATARRNNGNAQAAVQARLTPERRKQWNENSSKGLKASYFSYTPEQRKRRSDAMAEALAKRTPEQRKRHRDAMVEGWALRRTKHTHCPHGHPFDEENTHTSSRGYRHCKICRRKQEREAYKAKKTILSSKVASM
jgi:hypothetical protein